MVEPKVYPPELVNPCQACGARSWEPCIKLNGAVIQPHRARR